MEEFIGGKHSVLEAIRSGRTIHKIWIAENVQKQMVQAVISEARQGGVTVQFVDKRKLEQMAGDVRHQGVVAQVAVRGYVELDELLEGAASANKTPFLLVLDEIEDPHNLGSIVRTADCAGVDGLIIPKRRSAGLTATVSKISAGAVEYVSVSRVTNIAQTLDYLKKRGIWVIGSDAAAEREVYETDFTLPIALVIGNENKGMGRLIREKCDMLVRLPMHGRIQSLNASVAAGILMYEAVRQRGMKR